MKATANPTAFDTARKAHDQAAADIAAYEAAVREAHRLHAVAYNAASIAHQLSRDAHLVALSAGDEPPEWVYAPPAREVAPFIEDVAAAIGR